ARVNCRPASWPTGSWPTACRCASRCSCTRSSGTTNPAAEFRNVHPTHAARPMKNAVALVSGGMDSAVVLAIAREQGFAVHALSVRYGQRHTSELDAADRVARELGAVAHKTVDVDLRSIGGSALTDDIDVPVDGAGAAGTGGIPVTYVPARNTIMLSLALGWAE